MRKSSTTFSFTLFSNNLGATYLSANLVFHSHMKRLAINYHFVRELVQLSHPDSLSDPIGGSEPSSGCETIYLGFFTCFFFFKVELVPVGMTHIL